MGFDPHNCLLFAVAMWWRHGGFVIVRKSHYGWWPHFLWSADLITFLEYTPAQPNHHLLIPPPWYRGVVKRTTAGEQSSKPQKNLT